MLRASRQPADGPVACLTTRSTPASRMHAQVKSAAAGASMTVRAWEGVAGASTVAPVERTTMMSVTAAPQAAGNAASRTPFARWD
jgi:hypothetical protein